MECKGGRSNTWDGGFQGEEQNWDSVARIKTLSLVTSFTAQKPHHFLPRDCQETDREYHQFPKPREGNEQPQTLRNTCSEPEIRTGI